MKNLLKDFPKHRRSILPHAFTKLPWERPHAASLKKLPAGITLAIVGMGGSSLGTRAIVKALSPEAPVIFFDNIDPHYVASQQKKIKKGKTKFLFVSKSGETIEILSLAPQLFKLSGGNRHCLVITDEPKSSLGQFAARHSIHVILSPHNVPGRFSALSVVSLIPAALLGLDTEALLDGAKRVKMERAYELSVQQYEHAKQKRNITVMFPYSERLVHFAHWYAQLLAESIGKTPRIGITPVAAIGVKDQHSVLQLFLDGPDDKFYIFLKPTIYHRSKLFDAEYQGVIAAFKKRKRPYVEIQLPDISEKSMGELMYFFELEVAFLGSLFNINAFNQPAVELSKKFTKEFLGIC